MILEAYARARAPLVFVGNWENSSYGRRLRQAYGDRPWISLLDPVYDPALLQRIRRRASVYVHGHFAGGTNPSLVEMMHFDVPVLAFDCTYNRYTTEDEASYFADADALAVLAAEDACWARGAVLGAIARRRYTWSRIGACYYDLLRALREQEPGRLQDDWQNGHMTSQSCMRFRSMRQRQAVFRRTVDWLAG